MIIGVLNPAFESRRRPGRPPLPGPPRGRAGATRLFRPAACAGVTEGLTTLEIGPAPPTRHFFRNRCRFFLTRFKPLIYFAKGR